MGGGQREVVKVRSKMLTKEGWSKESGQRGVVKE
jgi:hypothetical protein